MVSRARIYQRWRSCNAHWNHTFYHSRIIFRGDKFIQGKLFLKSTYMFCGLKFEFWAFLQKKMPARSLLITFSSLYSTGKWFNVKQIGAFCLLTVVVSLLPKHQINLGFLNFEFHQRNISSAKYFISQIFHRRNFSSAKFFLPQNLKKSN